jgi:hypothetical protein
MDCFAIENVNYAWTTEQAGKLVKHGIPMKYGPIHTLAGDNTTHFIYL